MWLNSFPTPDLPTGANALSDKVRELNAQIMADIREQAEGVERETGKSPPG